MDSDKGCILSKEGKALSKAIVHYLSQADKWPVSLQATATL